MTSAARVLIVVENLSVPTDRRVWKEARTLTGAGYDVTVVCPAGRARDTAPRETIDGVEVVRFPAREAGGGPWGYLREYGHALRCIRAEARRLAAARPFDVVQLCNPPDVLFLAVRSLRRRGTSVVFDHHDLVPELFEVRFGSAGGPLRRAAVTAERRTYRAADVALATNESYRRVAIERGGMRPEDVFVVRMAPDLALFRPGEPDPALRRGAPLLVAYAGTIGPQDGVDHALRALRLLADTRDDWHAVIAGDGDAAPAVRALAGELGLADRVDFPGYLDDAGLIRLLSTADVCLSPEPRNPLNEASTMIKVVEYVAMGRPVVAYDLAETRFSAGDAAVYATGDDPPAFAAALERVLDDPALRERMSAEGRRRASGHLAWERSEEQLLTAYERALSRRSDGENPPERL